MADPTSKGGSLPLVRTSLLSTPSAGTPRNAPSPAVMLTKVSISFSNPRNSKKGPHGLDFANAKSVFDCLAELAPTPPLMPEKGTLRPGLTAKRTHYGLRPLLSAWRPGIRRRFS